MHVYHLPVYASFQCEDRCRVTSTAPSAVTRIPFGMTARLMICALSLTGLAACGGGGGGGLAASTTPLQLDNIVDASAGSGTDANAGGRLALILATPVQITGGNLLYDIPVARALSGQVAVSRRHLPLRPAEYEHDIGLSFSRNWLDGALQTKGFVELRMNAPAANPHRKGPTPHAGLAMSLTF